MNRLEKFLILTNILIYFVLAIFSFSQVDLNLTLNDNRLFLNFTTMMQELGYYNRPASSVIFIFLEFLTFSFFILNLYLFYKRMISLKYLLILLFSSVILLIFAYPFLSSDIFNYLFDAKIILKYASNPYTHKPLDFPQDEWLRFMRWTHRYSPYGPAWLSISLLPAIMGFGKFILTLISFKIFISVFHLINTYLVYKIVSKLNPKMAVFGTSFYALNPLILIEGIANGHNDIVQATFILLPILFLLNRNNILSIFSLIIGILIKYLSIFIMPLIIIEFFSKKKNSKRLVSLSILSLSVFLVVYSSVGIKTPFVNQGSIQTQFQPWYLIWVLPLISLIPSPNLIAAATALSIGASLRYLPFLYYGDWSHPYTILFMQLITILPAISISIYLLISKKLLLR